MAYQIQKLYDRRDSQQAFDDLSFALAVGLSKRRQEHGKT